MKKSLSLVLTSGFIFSAGMLHAQAIENDDMSHVVCTMQYEPVCGVHKTTNEMRTFGNSCMLGAAKNFRFVHDGECQKDPIYAGYEAPNDADLLAWAQKYGLTTKKTIEDFGGDLSITRDEVAVVLHRSMKAGLLPVGLITEEEHIFDDYTEISPEFHEAIKSMYYMGIMKGHNNIFGPKRFLSYKEAAIIMSRIFPQNQDIQATLKHAPDAPISRAEFFRALHAIFSAQNEWEKAVQNRIEGKWEFHSRLTRATNTRVSLAEPVLLEITGNSLSVQFCNTMNATIRVQGNSIMADGFARTKMMCESNRMDLEDSFQFKNATYHITSDGQLIIATDTHSFFFQKEATGNQKNLAGNWKMTSASQSGKTIPIAENSAPTMNIQGNTLSAKVCNHIQTTFSVDAYKITAGPGMSTLMACLDENMTTLERLMNFQEANYRLSADKNTLDLFTTNDAHMTFTRTK